MALDFAKGGPEAQVEREVGDGGAQGEALAVTKFELGPGRG